MHVHAVHILRQESVRDGPAACWGALSRVPEGGVKCPSSVSASLSARGERTRELCMRSPGALLREPPSYTRYACYGASLVPWVAASAVCGYSVFGEALCGGPPLRAHKVLFRETACVRLWPSARRQAKEATHCTCGAVPCTSPRTRYDRGCMVPSTVRVLTALFAYDSAPGSLPRRGVITGSFACAFPFPARGLTPTAARFRPPSSCVDGYRSSESLRCGRCD